MSVPRIEALHPPQERGVRIDDDRRGLGLPSERELHFRAGQLLQNLLARGAYLHVRRDTLGIVATQAIGEERVELAGGRAGIHGGLNQPSGRMDSIRSI